MKHFIFKTIIFSFPLFMILIGVNYFGDAAMLFRDQYEKQMAEMILSKKNVTNIKNYDERLFQKEIIHGMKEPPELLILGSSRTMLINSDHFPGKKIFNNSVSGASIEDLIAIYQLYRENNLLPEKILIGIDPWTFNDNHGQKRWKSIARYYERFHKKEHPKASNPYLPSLNGKYKQLISLSYFQSSIKNIPNIIKGTLKPVSTKDKLNITNTKIIDGSLVYGEGYRNASQELINVKIGNYTRGKIYSLENFDKVSSGIWKEFQLFIDRMEKNETKIAFFLSPYAPPAFEKLQQKYPAVKKSEKMIRGFANKKKIKVYGSFNPFQLGFDNSHFYDGMHCNEKGINKILGRN